MAANFLRTGRKIVAIGRNFGDHAKELGNAVPTKPFFFLKPTSSYCPVGSKIEIPVGCDVHHEVELGVVIGKDCRDVHSKDAMSVVGGYALALDMTARNLQDAAKKAGLPWSAAKGFDTFTPISDFIEAKRIADPHNVDLWLTVNGNVKQDGNTRNMIFDIPSLIAHVSGIMKLEVGDVILTGTPKGVGAVKAGDVVEAGLRIEGKELIRARWETEARRVLGQL
ncbi:Acylpyruvase fahd1, mitochondrial [Sorochytrium milnesiophthora]